jgi:hypothetical protein
MMTLKLVTRPLITVTVSSVPIIIPEAYLKMVDSSWSPEDPDHLLWIPQSLVPEEDEGSILIGMRLRYLLYFMLTHRANTTQISDAGALFRGRRSSSNCQENKQPHFSSSESVEHCNY